VVLWNFETGDEVQSFYGDETSPTVNVVFSPDGQSAFSSQAYPKGDVIQWRTADMSLDELRNWVSKNRYSRSLTCSERAQYGVEPLCATAQ
jgi:WD40 repeat protein